MSLPIAKAALRVDLLREQRYRKHFLREDRRAATIVMGTVGAAYSIALINDFYLFDDRILLGISIATRGLLAVGIVVALLLLRRATLPRQQDRAVNIGFVAIAIFVSANSLTRLPLGKFVGPFVATAVLLVLLYFVQRGPLISRAAVSCVTSTVAYVLIFAAEPPIELPARITCLFAFITMNVVGVLSARAFEENRRTRFEAERRERHARQALAIEKERAEAMSRARAAFLAAMSHEFRTPMNAVIGLSDLLLDAPLANEHWRHVRTINESARALLVMLNEILDFAKIDAQKLSLSYAPFDIRDLATSIVDMLRPQANKRSIEISLDMSPDIPKDTIGDDVRIRQALVNIVSNAIKFTERGSVKLRIESRLLERNTHEMTFCVEDTGIGMSPEVLKRLFRPFEQANAAVTRRYGGTGLGLAISKQIVNAMGGDIQVESEIGRGSVFSFKLALETVTSPHAAATALSPGDRPNLTILVVDDNAINREVARAKLGQLGYFVDLVSDGAAAIEAVSNKKYDVVFMDLRMPEMTGIEATTRIGEKLAGKRLPHIVAMTASVFEEDREACRNAGMRDFVGKPIDLVQIDALLRRIADERGVAPSAPNPNTPLVKETIVALKDMPALDQPDLLAQITKLFITELEKCFPRMVEALGRDDMQTIEDDAHRLKSTSAALGAVRMSELCARVEVAARQGRSAEVRVHFDLLLVERQAVELALLQETGVWGEGRQRRPEAPNVQRGDAS